MNHPLRRQTDGQPPNAIPLAKLVREWAPAVVGLAAVLGANLTTPGARFAAIEREQLADRVRDSVSILDRQSNAAAISLLGRSACIDNRAKATERGYPCDALLSGTGAWPLLHTARAVASSTALAPTPRVLATGALPDGTTTRAVASLLLVPASLR